VDKRRVMLHTQRMNHTRSSKVEALADLLKRTRRGALLSQQDIADQLAISRRSVSAYESGETEPPATVVLDWLAACGRPIDDLNRIRSSDQQFPGSGWSLTEAERTMMFDEPFGPLPNTNEAGRPIDAGTMLTLSGPSVTAAA
jgi:transcriptional regulator with XRE-family HTH domain